MRRCRRLPPRPSGGRSTVDVSDPRLADLFRHDLASFLVSGVGKPEQLDRILRGTTMGQILVVRDPLGHPMWAVSLLLRGVEVANRVWGDGGAPPGVTRVVAPPDVSAAEILVAPVREWQAFSSFEK